jgi:hypothetical protein
MPKKFSRDTLPTPNNKDVVIKEVPVRQSTGRRSLVVSAHARDTGWHSSMCRLVDVWRSCRACLSAWAQGHMAAALQFQGHVR